MDLSSLRAERPVAPKLNVADKRVQSILRDLEKIKYTKPNKQFKKCEHLIYYIVQALRRAESDHLLHTTAIFALINMFRLFPESSREFMLSAGVAGVLHDILTSNLLTGSTRQYASELCFYLSTNQPYPQAGDVPIAGPLKALPEVAAVNKYSEALDNISVCSDLSSIDHARTGNNKQKFVPYRIDAQNLNKLESLFSNGYEHELAASLPNPVFMSQFGFSDKKKAQKKNRHRNNSHQGGGGSIDGDSDDDEEDDDDQSLDGDASVSSSISSGSRSLQYSQSSGSVAHRRSSSIASSQQPFSSRKSSHSVAGGGANQFANRVSALQQLTHQQQALTSVSYDLQPMSTLRSLNTASAPAGSTFAGISYGQTQYNSSSGHGDNGGRGGMRSSGSSYVNKIHSIQQQQQQQQYHDETYDAFVQSSPPRYRPKTTSEEYNRSGNFRIGGGPQSHSSYSNSSEARGHSPDHRHQGHEFSSPHRHHSAAAANEATMYGREIDDDQSAASSHDFFPDTLTSATRKPHTAWGGTGFAENSLLTYNSSDTAGYPSSSVSNMQFFAKLPPGKAAQHAMTGGYSPQSVSKNRRAQTTGTLQPHTVSASGLDDFMSALDPLALNVSIGLHAQPFSTSDTLASDDEDEDQGEDALFSDEDDDRDPDIRNLNDSTYTERSHSNPNQFIIRKRTRIRAEKLVDHKFTHSLFVRKATIKDTQNLIARMESMLQLLDTESTGFVPWESFARVIMAVAPSHLLRADVLAFMDAQTDSPANLIDYNEFVISGKVMVVEKAAQKAQATLPIGGWLARQRTIASDDSTYTWKNHVKWYQQRKSRAVIWLIRRAARSLKQATRLEDAAKYLLKQKVKAVAVTYLLEVAHMALGAKGKRMDAKRNLMLRCIHARKWVRTMDEAQRWLVSQAQAVLASMAFEDSVRELKRQNRFEEAERIEASKKKQADYASLYKVAQLSRIAAKFLREKAQAAQRYCAQQDAAIEYLQEYVARVQIQLMVKEEAQSWLLSCAERAYQYCIKQDNVLLSLMRVGTNAYKFRERQDASLAWLRARGGRAVQFLDKKDAVLGFMHRFGSSTLSHLNSREYAQHYLTLRCRQAERLLVRQKEAIAFLQEKPRGVWRVEMEIAKAQIWLAGRGVKAVQLAENKRKAFQKLQFIASRATFMQRKLTIAHSELVQVGQQARLAHFYEITKDMPAFVGRLKEEKWHMEKEHKRHLQQQLDHTAGGGGAGGAGGAGGGAPITATQQQKWRAELTEAFDWLALLYSTPALHPPKRRLLGRLGFRRLMQEGKLLGLKLDSLDEHFKSVDPASACFVPFEAVWPWFLHQAERRNKAQLAKNKSNFFRFKAIDIIGAEERAGISLMRRINSERNAADDLLHYDRELYKQSSKGKKKGAQDGDEDDSSEGEEDDDDEDEDALFGDIEYLKSGGADVGKLMRYLTRRKEAAAIAAATKEAADRAAQAQTAASEAAMAALLNSETDAGDSLVAKGESVDNAAATAAVETLVAETDEIDLKCKATKEV